MLAAVCACSIAVQAPSLDAWFVFDDPWFLASANNFGFWEYVLRSFDPGKVGSLAELDRYRPLWPVVVRAQIELFGLGAPAYHAFALGLHILSVVLVWRLALVLGLGRRRANLAAAVFALHPAYAEAIAWVTAANRVVLVPPAVGSLLAWLAWCDRRSPAWVSLAAALFLITVLLHPSAVSLAPVYLALAWHRREAGGLSFGHRDVLAWVPIAILTAAYLGVQLWLWRSSLGNEGFELGWHIWANFGAFFGMAIVPVCSASLGCYDTPLRSAVNVLLLGGSVLFPLAALATIRRYPIASLANVFLVWFVISLAPDTTLVMGAFGRTMYLAGVPLALWVACSLPDATERLSSRVGSIGPRLVALAGLAVFALALVVNAYLVLEVCAAGKENEAFISQLRRTHPTIPAGSTLLVEHAPMNLTAFDDSRLKALVQVYFPDVTVVSAQRSSEAFATGPLIEFRFER